MEKSALLQKIKETIPRTKIYQVIEFPDFTLKGTSTERRRPNPGLRMKLFEGLDLKGKVVYDLGCSNGYFCYELAKRGAKVIGIDKNPEMLALNRLIAEYYGLDIEFIEGNLLDLNFYQQQMKESDIVIFFSVMHHLNYQQKIDPISYCRKIIEALSRKTKTLYFESGQTGEPFSWSVKLGAMGLDPKQWIQDNWLSTSFKNIQVLEPLAFEGRGGSTRKYVSTIFRRKEFEPHRPIMRLIAFILYSLFISDSRETRYTFICKN